MKKIKFTEGDYDVWFETQRVVKLDNHRFYGYVSGRNFKGVDFMVADPDLGLVLIELKDFRDAANIPDRQEVFKTFLEKCEDTLRLLEIIRSYYLRKPWLNYLWNKWPGVVFGEPKFWLVAAQLADEKRVLLLEDVTVS